MKVALVGAGDIAKVHIECIKSIPGAQLVGVCDKYVTRAEHLCSLSEQGGKAYKNYGDMLVELKPDIVHICLPPNLHYPFAKQALELGVSVLVEKPFTVSVDHAIELYDIAEKTGAIISPMYNHLFDPAMLQVRELVASGAIGEVAAVESYYGFNLGGEKSKYNLKNSTHWVFDTPGAHLLNIGPHVISCLLPFMSGANANYQTAVLNRAGKKQGVFDEYRTLITDEKTIGVFSLSMNAKPFFHNLSIYGTKKTIRYDIANWYFYVESLSDRMPNAVARAVNNMASGASRIGSTITSTVKFFTGRLSHYDGIRNLIQKTYEAIESKGEPPVSKDLNLRAVAGLETILNQSNAFKLES